MAAQSGTQRFVLVGTRCAGHGRLTVRIDGKVVSTVDTRPSNTQERVRLLDERAR